MISIRRAGNELERKEALLRAAVEAFTQGIRSAADYAVEIEPDGASGLRTTLQQLQRQSADTAMPEEWTAIQSSVRGELRAYRDQATRQLERLRAEITATGNAVNLFAESVTASDSDHVVKIKQAVNDLHAASRSANAQDIRTNIPRIAGVISDGIEAIERGHRVALMQLRAEIRLLHDQVDRERNVHLIDEASGVWKRNKLDARVAKLVADSRPFCIVLVHIRGLAHLHGRFSPAVLASALQALGARLESLVGPDALVGRWMDDCFAAIVEIPSAQAIALSRAAGEKLSGDYPAQEEGRTRKVPLVIVAGVIDHTATGNDTPFGRKLQQMSEALAAE